MDGRATSCWESVCKPRPRKMKLARDEVPGIHCMLHADRRRYGLSRFTRGGDVLRIRNV